MRNDAASRRRGRFFKDGGMKTRCRRRWQACFFGSVLLCAEYRARSVERVASKWIRAWADRGFCAYPDSSDVRGVWRTIAFEGRIVN